jgi:hypothetical protein
LITSITLSFSIYIYSNARRSHSDKNFPECNGDEKNLIFGVVKKLFSSLFVAGVSCSTLLAQTNTPNDSTYTVKDSIGDRTIHFTPYYSQSISESANYAVKIDDEDILRFSSGVSIFNALRGRVPGMAIQPYAIGAVPGMRGDPSSFFVDGVLFDGDLGYYYNLNASEFASVSAMNSESGAMFANARGRGAFVLQSKTGEGFDRATFEVNSYTTFGWGSVRGWYGFGSPKEEELNLSNSIVYKQDFGAIDTRISYSLISRVRDAANYQHHALKINTGIVLTPRMNIRVIIDDKFQPYNYLENTQFDTAKTHRTGNFHFSQGNLVATYAIRPWLTLSSQTIFSLNKAVDRTYEYSWSTKRGSGNIFISAAKKISASLVVKGFSGVQAERKSMPVSGASKASSTATDVVLGGGLVFRSLFYPTLIYRLSSYEYTGVPVKRFSNYSASGAFAFSELVKFPMMTSGKVRVSYGNNVYPNYIYDTGGVTASLNDNYTTEAGTDLGFLDNRISMSVTYFKNKTLSDARSAKMERRGWEMAGNVDLTYSNNVSHQSGIVYYRFNSRFVPYDPLLNQYDIRWQPADWIIHFRQQVTVKNLIVSLLFEHAHNSLNGYSEDQKFTKLRDVSIGYSTSVRTLGMQKFWISLSGRNLFKDVSSYDFEEDIVYKTYLDSTTIQESISLNLGAVF